jgi:hypothetical protein
MQLEKAMGSLQNEMGTIVYRRGVWLVNAATNQNITSQQDVMWERERTRSGVMGGRKVTGGHLLRSSCRSWRNVSDGDSSILW